MVKIYHNPRCRKSREALDFLKKRDHNIQIIRYLEENLNSGDLLALLKKIKLSPLEIVRKNETVWKLKYSKMELNEKEIIEILSENPQLIERPIVEFENSGVLARPLDKLIRFLKVGA